jgi:hypothetical protein
MLFFKMNVLMQIRFEFGQCFVECLIADACVWCPTQQVVFAERDERLRAVRTDADVVNFRD